MTGEPATPSEQGLSAGHRSHSIFSWAGWTSVGAFVTTLTAITAIFFSTKSLQSNEQQYELSRVGQLADRFTKSVEQLGSPQVETQLGGIYSLEQLAAQDVGYQQVAYEVLAAYVRTNVGLPSVLSSGEEDPCTNAEMPPIEISAVIEVIGRRATADDQGIALNMTCLVGASPQESTNFANVSFASSDMRGAFLMGSTFESGNLANANLSDAQLYGVRLTNTRMRRVILRGASITEANFEGADVDDADFTGADLSGADLSGARNLDTADLTGVYYDDATRWPEGFDLPN